MTRGGRRPIRRQRGAIVVELPDLARDFLVRTAEGVRASAEDPASAGYRRLFAQLDGDAEADDPLVTLERQTAIDEVCRTVTASAHRDRLSDAEAEAWLQVLGMAVAMTTAAAGVQTDDDLADLDPDLTQLLDLMRSLQLLVAFSLDPAVEAVADVGDLEGPEGPEPD